MHQKTRLEPWQVALRIIVIAYLVVPLRLPDHPYLPAFQYIAVRTIEWLQEPPTPMPPEIAEMERIANGH